MMITITTSINNCCSCSSPSSSLFIDLTSIDWVNRKKEKMKIKVEVNVKEREIEREKKRGNEGGRGNVNSINKQ